MKSSNQSKFNFSYPIDGSDIAGFYTCSACQSNSWDLVSQVWSAVDSLMFLETSICEVCTHIQRTRTLNENWNWIMANYRNRYQKQIGFEPINQIAERNRITRYRKIAQALISELGLDTSAVSLVDFGCGTGLGLTAWQELGLNCKGVEVDDSRAIIGRSYGLKIETTSIQSYLESRTAEVSEERIFTLIHTLEHIQEPSSFLQFLSSYFTTTDFLYIEVPNSTEFIKDWNDLLYLGHAHNFSVRSLKSILTQNRFHFKEVYPYGEGTDDQKLNLCFIVSRSPFLPTEEVEVTEVAARDSIFGSLPDSRPGGGLFSSFMKSRMFYSIPSSKSAHNIEIEIPFINDLMLSYKRNPFSILDSVSKNQHDREIFLKSNRYYVN